MEVYVCFTNYCIDTINPKVLAIFSTVRTVLIILTLNYFSTCSEFINSSRGQFYSSFKTDFSFENYLTRLSENNKNMDNKTACAHVI